MLDRPLRTTKERTFATVASAASTVVGPLPLTLVAAGAGVLAGVAAWRGAHALALMAFLASRVLDGLDGAIARHRNAATDLGGYVDMVLDSVTYVAVPMGLAADADQRATWIAVGWLLASFYVNAVSWAYLSAILEKRQAGAGARAELTTVTMPAGLIEGTETIAFYVGFLLWPSAITALFGAMAVAVAATTVQRVVWATAELR